MCLIRWHASLLQGRRKLSVRKGEEQHLIDLYHTQLEDYAQALERMLQKKVKETYIYSFALGKMIPV